MPQSDPRTQMAFKHEIFTELERWLDDSTNSKEHMVRALGESTEDAIRYLVNECILTQQQERLILNGPYRESVRYLCGKMCQALSHLTMGKALNAWHIEGACPNGIYALVQDTEHQVFFIVVSPAIPLGAVAAKLQDATDPRFVEQIREARDRLDLMVRQAEHQARVRE